MGKISWSKGGYQSVRILKMVRIFQEDTSLGSILAVFRLFPAGIMPLNRCLDLLCAVPAACHKRAGLIGY
jgi:hypothetical protein